MKSEVAIVLGAGSSKGNASPVFKERLNHAKHLYQKGIVKYIIITGGFGEGQVISDSKAGKNYLIKQNIPAPSLLIEEKSRYTIENLIQAKCIMDSMKFKTALIVSDPLHMKRAMSLANKQQIKCKPSPTPTTMYKSFIPKAKSLFYETLYYTLGQILGRKK